jgi:hypothetical protein
MRCGKSCRSLSAAWRLAEPCNVLLYCWAGLCCVHVDRRNCRTPATPSAGLQKVISSGIAVTVAHAGGRQCAAEQQDARHVQLGDDWQDEEGRRPGALNLFGCSHGLGKTNDASVPSRCSTCR